jgi:hypothetical protein
MIIVWIIIGFIGVEFLMWWLSKSELIISILTSFCFLYFFIIESGEKKKVDDLNKNKG